MHEDNLPQDQQRNEKPTGIPNDLSKIKKYFMYVLVASLSLAALISIVAIIVGDFSSVIQKSFATVFMIFIHALLSLAFISVDKNKGGSSFTVNVMFGIIVASFIVSSLGIWEIISGTLTGQIYQLFMTTIIAAVFLELFSKLLKKDKSVKYFSYGSMASVVLLYALFMPLIFTEYPVDLPNLYYRLLAASGVLAGTLSILTAIFHRLYVAKHPELRQPNHDNKAMHPVIKAVLWIMGSLAFIFIGIPIIFMILLSIAR